MAQQQAAVASCQVSNRAEIGAAEVGRMNMRAEIAENEIEDNKQLRAEKH